MTLSTELKLSEVVTIFDGPHATPTRQESGAYFLNISSLNNGRLDLSQSDHVSDQDFVRWTRRVTPRSGDLLFSYETRLGQAALMPPGVRACLGRRMALMRPDLTQVDPRFLLYLYLSPAFQETIEQNTIHGATVNRIPLNSMGGWTLRLPPLPEQQAIAEVLGALDDKITANTRLAATADKLAGQLYNSGTTGWPRHAISNILNPILGGTPGRARDDYWNPPTELWISARDITSAPNRVVLDTAERISSLAATATKVKPLPVGSVIITARGTVGAVARLAHPAAFNQSCYGFVPDSVPAAILFYSILRAAEHAQKIAHGSVFDTITKATFDHLDMAWNPDEAESLSARLSPLLHTIDGALEENRTLSATRDALLPKLMSGALRVADVYKIVEDAS